MGAFEVSSIINAIISAIIAVVVFFSQRKNRVNQVWALTTLLLALWSTGLSGVVAARSASTALRWQHLLDASAIPIPITFFIFVVYLLKKQDIYRRSIRLSWLACALLVALSFTPLFKLGVAPRFNFDFWIIPGPLYVAFPLIFIIFVTYSLYLLLRERMTTTDRALKWQINYVLAAQVFGFGGGITNFFPQLWNIYPIGNYVIIVYIFFISYSIFKHNLFNIKVIATELLIYAIWIFLGARLLLAETNKERALEGTLLFFLVIFGVLLIRSVRQEVKQKEELQALTKKMQDANKKLKALDVARQEFLSIASHQLRTPPATIKWYLASVLAGDFGPLSDDLRGALIKTQTTNNGLISLIEDLLNVSRIERGKMEFFFEPAQVENVVKSAFDQLEPIAKEKKLEFTFIPSETPLPPVTVDKEKIKQVVNNLMDNAIKYTPKGFVRAEMGRDKNNIIVRVHDSGKGVSIEDQKSIFQKYTRGNDAHHHSMGLGLGLYVARVIVEQHHGKIWVESKGENQGSSFVLSLPIRNNLQPTTLVDLTK